MSAADSLAGFYMRKKQYDKAEKYLEYFSIQNPERKRKQAQTYAETGRMQEAYKAYEELLFTDYQRVSMELHGIYLLALKENDMEKARSIVQKQAEAAKFFEMGKYYEVSSFFEIAALEKDADLARKCGRLAGGHSAQSLGSGPSGSVFQLSHRASRTET
ncbi:MAG TPA: hypothetical protein H9748_06355 [Candidatus Mediterraneibacter norwichensis]|nr:hypothetical protein [Candidatus Mediterraneibacter norwichensis]